MTHSIPVISTSKYEVTDAWGQVKKFYAWTIHRNGSITESGKGYDNECDALNFAIGVANETIA